MGYTQIMLAHSITKQGQKLPSNPAIDKQLLTFGLEFTKTNGTISFEEMKNLTTEERKNILNSTSPALYVVFYSILEANRNQESWLAQMTRTFYFTKSFRWPQRRWCQTLPACLPSVYWTWRGSPQPGLQIQDRRTDLSKR